MIERVRRGLTRGRTEALIAIAVFAAAAWWGTTYWRLSLQAGREPQFYQQYFEPAVMIACGHGFVIAHPAPAPLVDFLQRKVNTFSCEQVAGNLDLSTQYLYQGAWRYLMYAVGLTWRLVGVSWKGLAPLFGFLFGLTIVAAYGIFRQGMGRGLALAGAGLLSVSTLHLSNLPHLRDYSKAPFTLLTVLILGVLVRLQVRRAVVVLLCVAYGVVLGIGYGFRTDLLVNIVPIVVVLFLFLEGGLRKHLATKTLGLASFAVAFLVTAWPILSFVSKNGGGQWHVVLLGLTKPFDEALRIEPAPYQLADFYKDGYVGRVALGYAARVHPEWHDAVIFTHEYDLATAAYFRELVSRFPGDMITRAYASAIDLTHLPYGWSAAPIDGLANWIYGPRRMLLSAMSGTGPYVVAAALIGAAAFDLRVGFFLLFFFLYFGGYPSLQFAVRHYFHLELMTLWAGGFVLYHAFRRTTPLSMKRIGIFVSVTAGLLLVPWGILRVYQEGQARRVLAGMVEAKRTPISLPTTDSSRWLPVSGPTAFNDVRLIEVDVKRWTCGAAPSITFRYDSKEPDYDFSQVVSVPPGTDGRQHTKVFVPIFSSVFKGLQLSPDAVACVDGAYWIDTDHRPVVLTATLSPGWETQKLYQRLWFEPGATHQ